jgi:hypothetical protein
MAGTTANLDNIKESVSTGNDSIVIIANLETIPGGKTLVTTGFTPTVINAGHIIIEETATGFLKPMPVVGTAYGALPGAHTYKGVLIASILTAKPFAAICIRGSVNMVASPFPVLPILPALNLALPLIRFTKD